MTCCIATLEQFRKRNLLSRSWKIYAVPSLGNTCIDLNSTLLLLVTVTLLSFPRYCSVREGWSGMRNLKIDAQFTKWGGTELAPMSTTTNLEVALAYSMSQNSLLFKIQTKFAGPTLHFFPLSRRNESFSIHLLRFVAQQVKRARLTSTWTIIPQPKDRQCGFVAKKTAQRWGVTHSCARAERIIKFTVVEVEAILARSKISGTFSV